MAKKIKKSSFDLNRVLLPIFLIGFIINGIVIFYFESSRKPKIVYCVKPSTSNPAATVVSNIIDNTSVSITNNVSTISSSVKLPVLTTTYYEYFVAAGAVGVRMFNDVEYYIGSLTSYGIIEMIFPDRIFIKGEGWIVNNAYNQPRSVSSSSTNSWSNIL